MKSSWLESGYLDDVGVDLHQKISLTMDLTTICLIENREVFNPILYSAVSLVKKIYISFPRLQNDVQTIIGVMYEYLYFYCQKIDVGKTDTELIESFVREYGKRFLN